MQRKSKFTLDIYRNGKWEQWATFETRAEAAEGGRRLTPICEDWSITPTSTWWLSPSASHHGE